MSSSTDGALRNASSYASVVPRAPAAVGASVSCTDTGENTMLVVAVAVESSALGGGGTRCLARRSARAIYPSRAAAAVVAMVVIEMGDEESRQVMRGVLTLEAARTVAST